MKTDLKQLVFFLLLLFSVLFNTITYSQSNPYRVIRGERPPIDLSAVPADAYEPGVLLIKINDEFSDMLEQNPVRIAADGKVKFGIKLLDDLNDKNRALNVKQYFLHPSMKNTFTEKHKAWGFHLWYRLEFDKTADIKILVQEYQSLAAVIIAEPEYRKELIGNVGSQNEINGTENQRNSRWTPDDPQYSNQWHYHNTGQQSGTPDADIDLPEAWEMEKGSAAVVVAIVDGGIQFNHPDLAANMWQNAQGHYGYNFVNNSTTIVPHDHGTHVAGTVAGVTNNATGVAGVAGGSGSGDGVRLMSCQVFTASSNGGFHLAPIYAADNGAAISQNSWSYTSPNVYEQNVLDAIDYFNVNGGGNVMNGGITIFAAGNSNSSANYYPGFYSGTMAVAGMSNTDQKAWYSNYGSWVDISAPGGETNTVTARGVLSTITGGSYAYYQGTSMACPHVSGVAALLLSYAERQNYMLENSELWEILVDNVDNHYPQNPGYTGQLGSGRLNAYLALTGLQAIMTGLVNPSNFIATAVSTTQINLTWVKNAGNNDVMLVWSPDGSFGAPVNGVIYNIGSTIPGGGTVRYKGQNTNYNHTGLNPATRYYYKAFSYDGLNQYSSGRNADATTFCEIFTALPLSQDFNASPPIPVCWEVIDNIGNGQVWQFGTHSNGLTGTTGNYAYLNSDAYGSGNSQNSDLVTPILDLSAYMNINLSFNHYFREYSGSSASLAYSTDNGNTWTQIQSWSTTTSNPATFSQQIPALAGQSQVRIRWKYAGTWGYYWDVDNVLITGTPNVPYADFYAEPLTAQIGETVTFYNSSGGGSFSTWYWNFGNGAVPANASGPGPHNVVYTTIGQKTVSLLVDNTYQAIKENYVTITPVQNFSSATYTSGDISTDFNFRTLGQSSVCPGTLTVNIPLGATITAVDVSYQMTAQNYGWKSEQRSQLRCVSAGGIAEASVYNGSGDAQGTQSYSRTGLNIANGVTGGGAITFELHAGRTWGGSGCSTTYNKVDNNTWTVTVHYYLIIPCLPVTSLTAENITANSADLGWTTQGDETSWNIEWGETGFQLGNGILIADVANNPYTLLNLEPATSYDFYVQANCGNSGNLSEWTGPHTFTTANLYLITAIPNNPAFGSVSGGGSYEHGETVTLAATPATGYHFVNWTEGGTEVSTEPNYAFIAEQNRTLVANFAINVYEITALPNNPAFGSVSGGGSYEHGETVTLTATPATGYHFVNWTEGGTEASTEPNYLFIAEQNRTLVANFAINVYEITALPNNPAFGSVSGGGSYEHGETVTLTATPATGYHFVNWTEGGTEVSTQPNYVFIAEQNRTLVANFAINVYEITVLPNNPAFGSVSGGGSYEHGETVTLTATPATGYHFVNWTEGGTEVSTEPNYAFIAEQNRTLVANFAINVYEITALPNNPAFGSVSGGGSYEHGETVTLTATPATGYHFVNWTEGGTEVSTEPNYVFIAEQNRTLVANFVTNVPDERYVQNLEILSGQVECFDAQETIYVSDFVVHPDAEVQLIAGTTVFLSSHTHAIQGSYLWIRISDEFCSQPGSMLASEEAVIAEQTLLPDSNRPGVKIYPNPTADMLNIEIFAITDNAGVAVELFNLVGTPLFRTLFSGMDKMAINLLDLPKGMYILRISNGSYTITEKVVRH